MSPLLYLELKVNPPKTFTSKCCPRHHTMVYKYLGENTVHMNRCVRSTIHATITPSNATELQSVVSDIYCNPTSSSLDPSSFSFPLFSDFLAALFIRLHSSN